MLYNVVLISALYQHESPRGIHMSAPSRTSLWIPTPSHPSRLLQRTSFEPPVSWQISTGYLILHMVRSMNQGKLEVIKQEMAGVNIDILGIRELKWTGMGEFKSDDHYIYYCQQESHRKNGVAIIVHRRVWNAVTGCDLKNRMISASFQGKPFNNTVIQVYAPTSNTEEAEDEWFYEALQDLLKLTPEKDVLFIIGDCNAKVGSL